MRSAGRSELAAALAAVRVQTLRMVEALDDGQWRVPLLATINPPLWEIGHVAWFQERWCLRNRDGVLADASLLADSDRFYDSAAVAHDTRWELDLPRLAATEAYLRDVLDACLARLAVAPETDAGLYFFRLALFHEMMHVEALAYTWQTLSYRAPLHPAPIVAPSVEPRDLAVPGGKAEFGARPGDGFCFDNEKWSHRAELAPYRIAARPVSNAQFLAFVTAGGYREARWWDAEAYAALVAAGRELPRYWRMAGDKVYARRFEHWLQLDPAAPVVHVDAHEAQAWCRWAGRRLPDEREWELAARTQPEFEWGDRVWEWTASAFEPYPGFSPDPYEQYSAPWFGDHRVVRGGSFATPRAMVDQRFRNFYLPDRGDIFVGFRSCART